MAGHTVQFAKHATAAFEVTVTTTTGGDVGIDEVQHVGLTNNGGLTPTGGTFTLTYSGQTTAGIAYNANAAAIVSALENLSNIGVGDVAVSGTLAAGFTVTFQGALAETDVDEMTANGASLTGPVVEIVTLAGVRPGIIRVRNREASNTGYFRIQTRDTYQATYPTVAADDTWVVPPSSKTDVAWAYSTARVVLAIAAGQDYSVESIAGLN